MKSTRNFQRTPIHCSGHPRPNYRPAEADSWTDEDYRAETSLTTKLTGAVATQSEAWQKLVELYNRIGWPKHLIPQQHNQQLTRHHQRYADS